MNVSFFCYALYKFAKEFVQDYKAHKQGIIKADLQDEYDRTQRSGVKSGGKKKGVSITQVQPVNDGSVSDGCNSSTDEANSFKSWKLKKKKIQI